MEDNTRPFKAINIDMAVAETGTERFTTNGDLRLPQIALWRVNLTALSQKYNLYFIASGKRIQVYEPEFPFQKLGGKPQLTITPHLANVNAQGYIQPREPHCINHVMVGNLGSQEILLLSTDSGNVIAYYTSSILNAIRKDPLRFSADAQAEFVGLRPFFLQWVLESAWGLAIHSESRMIAISANTPHHVEDSDRTSKITVFAFALTAAESDEEVENEFAEMNADGLNDFVDWTVWNSSSASSDTPKRDRNYKIVLAGVDGHTNNIPCIAFINGSQDPDGSWLLSTDIHGEIKMWRIWKGRCLRTWNFADRGSIGAAWIQRYEAGWLVAALDINSFRPTESNDTFIGHHRAPQYYGYDAAGPSYDITNIVRQHVPSNSIYHPGNPDIDDETQSEPDMLYENMSESEVTADEEETARVQRVVAELSSISSPFSRSSESGRHSPSRITSPTRTHSNATMTTTTQATTSDLDLDPDFDEDLTDDDSDVYVAESEEEEDDTGVQIESDFSNDEMSVDGHGGSTASPTSTSSVSSPKLRRNASFQETSDLSGRTKHGTSPTVQTLDGTRRKRIHIPDVPFIHCSTSHLRMFSGTDTRSPHLFCARMLKQMFSPDMEGLPVAQMDRLNMIEQIPELGIVIVASQVGRCAVCTLTRRRSDGLPGLRVDWILPTRKEERARVRPDLDPLLGIATGPIQGRLMTDSVPLSEHDSDDNWAKDRVIDGIFTSFDDKVVDMGSPNSPVSAGSDEDDSSQEESFQKRHYGKAKVPSQQTSLVQTKAFNWSKAKMNEDWMAMESSRRYRLMMTYADETVLTYELSRGVEKEDRDRRVQVRR